MDMLSDKKLFNSILKNESFDSNPFIPRLDLWYKAHTKRIPKLKILEGIDNINELYRSLGFIPYDCNPDFMPNDDLLTQIHRSIGFYSIPEAPYRIKFNKVKVKSKLIENKGNYELLVDYTTPIGSLNSTILYTNKMKMDGISLTYIKERIIKSPSDYKVCEYIFKDMIINDNRKEFDCWTNTQKKDFISIAWCNATPSGMWHLMRDFFSISDFFLELNDNKLKLEKLAKIVGKKIEEVVDLLCKCNSDIMLLGGNFDSILTYPKFYKNYIMPEFCKHVEKIHKNKKFVVSHCDSENKALWNLLLETGIDILEAVAVKPMVSQNLKEIINIVNNKAVIWGGINSISLLQNSINEYNFKKYIEEVINVARNNRIILGVSDTAPVDMSLDRLLYIRDMVKSS